MNYTFILQSEWGVNGKTIEERRGEGRHLCCIAGVLECLPRGVTASIATPTNDSISKEYKAQFESLSKSTTEYLHSGMYNS